MPAVTVPPRPNGSPIASTQSPTRALFESPQPMTGSGCLAFTLSSAKSVTASRPTTSAGRLVSSGSVTVMLSASAMTWLLVTTSPVGSMMKPEPSDGERGDGKAGAPLPPPSPPLPSCSPKKSWKNSSKGVPRPASAERAVRWVAGRRGAVLVASPLGLRFPRRLPRHQIHVVHHAPALARLAVGGEETVDRQRPLLGNARLGLVRARRLHRLQIVR